MVESITEMNGLLSYFKNLDYSVLTGFLKRVIPSLLCITLHELSHGYVAYRLGDDTAKRAGRLTLNPIRHIDPMGLLMMLVFRFGWAKPVPVNMMKFKNPKRGMAVTALAGPLSNFLICVFFLFLYGILYYPLYMLEKWGSFGSQLLEMVSTTAYLSLAMGIFNLLPIPPLDGSKVLYSVLSDRSYYLLMRYERYGMIALWLLVWSGAFGTPLTTAVGWLLKGLMPVTKWGFYIMTRFF